MPALPHHAYPCLLQRAPEAFSLQLEGMELLAPSRVNRSLDAMGSQLNLAAAYGSASGCHLYSLRGFAAFDAA